MNTGAVTSRLVDQIVRAARQCWCDQVLGHPLDMTTAIIRSLRTTLARALRQRGKHGIVPRDAFTCGVGRTGKLTVRHRGRILPVSAGYLIHLMKAAGVDLVAGQVLLLDPALARSVIEDSLAEMDIRSVKGAHARRWLADALAVAVGQEAAVPRTVDAPPGSW